MKILLIARFAITLVIGIHLLALSGCVTTDGGYGYRDDGYNSLDYYNTNGYYGGYYNGWDGNYYVGPSRGVEQHRHIGENLHKDADRPEPLSHSMPPVRVEPDRGGGEHAHIGGNPSPHVYTPAPISHTMPSIPSSPRSGPTSQPGVGRGR